MIEKAREALIAWFDENARDLPWRRTRDPYAIWVSEIMLQQTRVDTVIPYFERFLERFPTMSALASATEDEVLAMWSGLGYYRRARFLQRGVREAVEKYGAVPEDAEARRALPGVGAYTAGAIGSIAFDKNEPIVDGNVARVLSRFHLLRSLHGEASTTRELWTLASQWAEGKRPGTANQALMELGALICTPLEARCGLCPLASACLAREHGEQTELPRVAKKKPPRATLWSTALVSDASGKLLMARGDAALFGGLHGLPSVEGERDALLIELARYAPLATLPEEPAFEIRHVLSHRALTVRVYRACSKSFENGTLLLAESELDEVGVSKLTRKILDRASAPVEARAKRGRARRAEEGS